MTKVCGLSATQHFLKVKGENGESIDINNSSEFDAAFDKLNDPNNELTFGMRLPYDFHCTICFIEKNRSDVLKDTIRNYFNQLENYKDKCQINSSGLVGNSIVLLSFDNKDYMDLFLKTDKVGKREKGQKEGDPRVPHFRFYRKYGKIEGGLKKVKFVEEVIKNLTKMNWKD